MPVFLLLSACRPEASLVQLDLEPTDVTVDLGDCERDDVSATASAETTMAHRPGDPAVRVEIGGGLEYAADGVGATVDWDDGYNGKRNRLAGADVAVLDVNAMAFCESRYTAAAEPGEYTLLYPVIVHADDTDWVDRLAVYITVLGG